MRNDPTSIPSKNGTTPLETNPIKVNSYNEWDPLEAVVIGIADNARFPENDHVNDHVLQVDLAKEINQSTNVPIEMPPIPAFVIEETKEDLNIFATAMEKMGVTVLRPDAIDTKKKIASPYWETNPYFNYCPRDTMMVVGDTIIESPNMFPSRYFETFSYRDILLRCMDGGAGWIAAPKPRLRMEDCNIHPGSEITFNTPDPIFDAANVIKAGKDLFYLVSSSGNEAGYRWLKNTLGDKYRVHACRDLYSGIHLDTTITLLRPGLLLANPSRVNKDNLPEPLKKWDVIYAPKMANYSYSDLPKICSPWLGLNLFMVNPSLAVVDAHQTELIKVLEQHHIDVLPLKLRHGRLLGGGFHCVTLDLRRKGGLQDYFS